MNTEQAMESKNHSPVVVSEKTAENTGNQQKWDKSNEKNESAGTVPYYKLYSFADSMDYLLMFIGTIGAVGNGMCMSMMTLLFGKLVDSVGRAKARDMVDEVYKHSTAPFMHVGYRSAVLFNIIDQLSNDPSPSTCQLLVSFSKASSAVGNMAEENGLDREMNTEQAIESTNHSPVVESQKTPEKTSNQQSWDKSKEKKESTSTVPYYKLYSFADSMDYLLIFIGTISAVGNGMCMALMTIVFGDLIDSIGAALNAKHVVDKVSMVSLNFLYLGVGCGVASFFLFHGFKTWNILVGKNQKTSKPFGVEVNYYKGEPKKSRLQGKPCWSTFQETVFMPFCLYMIYVSFVMNSNGSVKCPFRERLACCDVFQLCLKTTLSQVDSIGATANTKHVVDQVSTVFFALTMAALGISQSSSLAPDASKAKSSAASVFAILDRKSNIDSSDNSGTTLENVEGKIKFHHVSFKYPTRPDLQVFRDLCLTIRSGKTVALVGESGSGKSTVISLLQRFYNPDSGSHYTGRN
ncbi:hypothetical protein L1049_016987 [Liquidambar formosana]|uniref:ABC transporter domain-containing protein n=1 Tax=Liquidambar formosana TaxID=63359 RepID=A0AAP0S087_LIQFO